MSLNKPFTTDDLRDPDTASTLKMLTGDRSQVSDITRQMSWHARNAAMNGWIDKIQYRAEMRKI